MNTDKKVWWAVLPERCVYDLSLTTAMKIAYRMGHEGWTPIWCQYGRTDVVRQGICEVFLKQSSGPLDTLVMLDIDHEHPAAIAQRLVERHCAVVVPLMFRRGEPYQACAFRLGEDGALHHLATFPPGLYRMDAVGMGAIAIQRHALLKLREAGHEWFFRYEYLPGLQSPSEDLYFSKICREAGVEMYVDTTIQTPHISLALVDRNTYEAYQADHPDYSTPAVMPDGSADGEDESALTVRGLTLDLKSFTAHSPRGASPLTPTQFNLLRYLMERPGQVFSPEQLMREVLGYVEPGADTQLIKSHVLNLRAKIEPNPEAPIYLTNHRGHGYSIPLTTM
jgi:hypothetical protein